MRKEHGVFGKRGAAGLQISLMIFSLFAFSFMISSVSADSPASSSAEEEANSMDSAGGNSGIGTGSNGDPGGGGDEKVTSAALTTTASSQASEFFGIKYGPGTLVKNGKTVGYVDKTSGAWLSADGKTALSKSDPSISEIKAGDFKAVGGGADALVSGAQWAAIAYTGGMMIGGFLGLGDANTQALSTSLAAGAGVFKALETYSPVGKSIFTGDGALAPLKTYSGYTGIAVGVIIFAAMYKDTEIEIIDFNCMAWQAPTGSSDCEICNDDDLPCSEYRCRSLGQSCELVNAGSEEEKCVSVNIDDSNPPMIRPSYDSLTSGHEYKDVKNSPPGPGFRIVDSKSGDGCIKAFTPLEFGIVLDEPGQCKIDFEHKENFEEMSTYFGGSNLYRYNHSEVFSLPSAEAVKNSSLILENGKDLTFFIRCQDKNGNQNEAEYAVRMCVDPSPDTTAPKIEATSITNGGCVAEDQANANVNFYTNEPADCRWSSVDQDYDNMQNTMVCDNKIYQSNSNQLFRCGATLTGIPREMTDFYIRCKDQPGANEVDRNENRQSFKFSLTGSTGLKLRNLQPNETIFGGVEPMPVELYAETLFGCNDGRAVCQYAPKGSNNFITFFDTDNDDGIHTQRLDLVSGSYEYTIRCVDAGGNLVENDVSFDLNVDANAPVVARIYEEDGMLKIITVRDSECAYTFDNCDFSFEEGVEMPYANSTNHVAEWNSDKTYYIKCRDEFKNIDADCSAIVKPSKVFL